MMTTILGIFAALVFGVFFMYAGAHAIYAGIAIILASFAKLFCGDSKKNE